MLTNVQRYVFKERFYILYILICLDLITTYYGLSLGASEVNPVLAPIITSWEGILLKLFLSPLIVFVLLKFLAGRNFKMTLKTFKYISIAMGLIVVWNTSMIALSYYFN
ncbi:UNVERIFIED_CONTAM: hypothetical protein Cloal_3689 [Acetivibrio alkalicellulosi]